jgi:hypothetical protein
MIVDITRLEDGEFLIEVEPEHGKPLKGIAWGDHFEYEGKDYIAQEVEPHLKDMKLTYRVRAVLA